MDLIIKLSLIIISCICGACIGIACCTLPLAVRMSAVLVLLLIFLVGLKLTKGIKE